MGKVCHREKIPAHVTVTLKRLSMYPCYIAYYGRPCSITPLTRLSFGEVSTSDVPDSTPVAARQHRSRSRDIRGYRIHEVVERMSGL